MMDLFTSLAAAYAENFADIELARAEFERERSALLERLATATKGPMTGAGSFRVRYVDDSPWHRLQAARGRQGQTSGYAFFFDRDFYFGAGDSLAFYAYAFFGSDMGTMRIVRALLPKEVAEVTSHADRFMRVRVARVPYDAPECSPDALEQAAAALPALFEEISTLVCRALGGAASEKGTS